MPKLHFPKTLVPGDHAAAGSFLPWISGSVRYNDLHGQSFCRWTMSFWHKHGPGSWSSWLSFAASRAETRDRSKPAVPFSGSPQLPSLTSIDLVMSSMDRPWIAPPTRAAILMMAVGIHVTLEYFRGFRFHKWFLAICWLDMARAMDIHIHY